MLKEKLLGTHGSWIRLRGQDEDGRTDHIMGEGCDRDYLLFAGRLGVRRDPARDRPRYDIPDTELGTDEQTLAAARGMFAYAGRFAVDEENQIVYHELEFSLIPNWIGSRQKRYVRFENGGNTLVLTADPVRIGKDGKRRRTALRWVRG
jgi:hypothetical protein